MKRIHILVLSIFILLISFTFASAKEEYPFPTSPAEAVKQANASVSAAGYDESNKYFFMNNIIGKPINPSLSVGKWGTFRDKISYGVYKKPVLRRRHDDF